MVQNAKAKLPRIINISRVKGGLKKWANYVIPAVIVILLALTLVYIINLTYFNKEGFDDGSRYEVILVHSQTCPHCRDFLPVFEKVKSNSATLFNGKSVVFTDVEASAAGDLMRYVSGVPTIIFKGKDGAVLTTLTGKRTEEQLITEINAVVK